MSEQNVELVRKGFEHFLTTGEPAWDTLHEQVEAHDHDIMDGRAYRGHADVRRWLFEDWDSAWSEWSAEKPEEYIDVDAEHVIAVFRVKATGRASGVAIEREDAMVFAVREQQVVRLDYYNNKQQALEAVARRDTVPGSRHAGPAATTN
jgi:ketosteroid isomerase-like protein